MICTGSEVIARHSRTYEREDMIFDPLHYPALLEQKSNSLDQAAPLVDWQLPEDFARLRRLLEARVSQRGKREFVQLVAFAGNIPAERSHLCRAAGLGVCSDQSRLIGAYTLALAARSQ